MSRPKRTDYKRKYPGDWDQIATQIKVTALWRCERCGQSHNPSEGYCLTVHHLDGDPENCTSENLVALCQRCHLYVQAKILPGQMVMACFVEPWMLGKNIQIYGDLHDSSPL